jgi:lipopolysaccharide transport protein LptA
LILFNIINRSSFALSSDDKLPTKLSANSAICNRQNEEDVCTYLGNAKLIQGTTNLQAQQIAIYKIIGGKINKIVASGEYARYGTVADNNNQSIDATAGVITIYPDKNTVLLEKNAQMAVGEDKFNADSAVCKRQSNESVCTYSGNAKLNRGTANLQAQQIVIYEKTKGKNNKIIASGEHSHYSDIPDSDHKSFDADANLITIYPDRNLMILEGNGQMTVGQDQYSGPHIEYKFK